MCSVFEFMDMDSFQGDLTDIVRGTGGGHVSSSPGPPERDWPPAPSDLHVDFPSAAGFGDPFVNMTDPLLQELNFVGYFSGGGATGDNTITTTTTTSSSCSNNDNNNNNFVVPKVFEDEQIKNQCSVFPRIRISQSNMIIHEAVAVSPRPPVVVGNDMINVVDGTNSPRNCLMDSNASSSQLQISSPRNLGLKRRKSQAKKVVCIPAPAAANSRSSGEVVPSDLWAWRKYGQKPIKGSPYPRGYYRCSSSKGCSARKQVERSRTDPNMLVITYTSEHNHPWPTQRNALAGSTRSSSKPSTSAVATSSRVSQASHSSPEDEPPKPNTHFPTATAAVKEEVRDERQDMDFDNGVNDDDDQPYRPELMSEDFFADLDELNGDDPLSLLLSQGFGSVAGDGDRKDKTAFVGDFGLDWSVNNNDDNTTSFEDRDDSNA